MANLEVLALDTATPQIRAPGAGDGYSVPRDITLSNNLIFGSTAQRITGDMSNATVANRLAFQTSTANSNTSVAAIPSGTATQSAFNAFNASDPTNSSTMQLICATADSRLTAGATGTGTNLPMTFYTGGSERMRLDTSGNLGIGTASPNKRFSVISGGSTQFTIETTAGANDIIKFDTYNASAVNGVYTWSQQGTERMRIDSSGRLSQGSNGTSANYSFIQDKTVTGATTVIGFGAQGVVQSDVTSVHAAFRSNATTAAASFTLNSLYHFQAGQPTLGAGSAVTNQMGFIAGNTLTGATNNYGFYSDIASGSNRWNFYAAGTAQNYFAGLTTIGTTNGDPVGNNVAGGALFADGRIQTSVASQTGLFVNRKTDDGTLVAFYQDGTQEGTISVSGNTVSYNAFAGSHWSQLQDDSKPSILRGTVMESINELCVWPDENNERLPKSKVSDTVGSKKVYGVFMAWDNDWTATNDMLVTSVGAFICRVNSSVTVQEGDLLESNGDGTARVQADDIIRSSTIGKVTSTVKTHQYADGSYCVPTVLYCG